MIEKETGGGGESQRERKIENDGNELKCQTANVRITFIPVRFCAVAIAGNFIFYMCEFRSAVT